jgi:imidazolonepropionase-like amidohydrolase
MAFSPLLLALALSAGADPAQGIVALKAGTIHVVNGASVSNGTILVRGGKILAVGTDVNVPANARVVDYGPDAVITPGLVAADSTIGRSVSASDRSADPTLLAIDLYEAETSFVFALQEGVTSSYIAPARRRLIAGQGAVVKLAGADDAHRVLSASNMIHGAISAEARATPGYWKPPVPAVIDIGLGYEKPQLPRTLMGAMVALRELIEQANGGAPNSEFGPEAAPALRELMEKKLPWRMAAESTEEAGALVAFARESRQPLVIDGGQGTSAIATEIAKAGVSVIVDAPILPNGFAGRDMGKGPDAQWPEFAVAAALEKAGVRFAISAPNNAPVSALRYSAAVASRGGLSETAALRAVTLSAAQILGVSDRVGSIEPGKDADFAVFAGAPLGGSGSALATWIDGEIVYKAYEAAATVLCVDELHLGDGTVLAPGEVLMENGKIRAVGRRVGRPAGATVVRGKSAMPGMIDAMSFLGLEGSQRTPGARFALSRILEPGDFTDRRVAQAGVTTVLMSPRGGSRTGTPMLAYKPAGTEVEDMVVSEASVLRVNWTERYRPQSGAVVRSQLAKAADYAKKWDEYEKKLASYVPPKPAAAAQPAAKKDEGAKKEGEAAKPEEKKEGEAAKPEEKKEDKKKKGEEEPAKPITGSWETKLVMGEGEGVRMRLYVSDVDGVICGSLRCASLSDDLISVEGKRTDKKVHLEGDGSKGRVTLDAEQVKGKLKGKVTLGETSAEFELEQKSTEYEVAARPEPRKAKDDKPEEPKGAPRSPGIDPELEAYRRAMKGQGAVIVQCDRMDEIIECVKAFEDAGIKPVLYSATEAYKVADQIAGRVAGVLLTQAVLVVDADAGARERNRFTELQNAGIPVAFHSAAEEGAADLPLMASYAISEGMSPEGALRALTSDVAKMMGLSARVGKLAVGMDADVLLLDGTPVEPATSVLRVWVNGQEVR